MAETRVIAASLQQNPSLLSGYRAEDYLRQLPTAKTIFATYSQSDKMTFRDLLNYLKQQRCIEPRRMITLEGLPLLASPRLAFGGEWYGDIHNNPYTKLHQSVPKLSIFN